MLQCTLFLWVSVFHSVKADKIEHSQRKASISLWIILFWIDKWQKLDITDEITRRLLWYLTSFTSFWLSFQSFREIQPQSEEVRNHLALMGRILPLGKDREVWEGVGEIQKDFWYTVRLMNITCRPEAWIQKLMD